MDPLSRWILILLFVVIVIWRLVRYVRLALAGRRTTLGAQGGWLLSTPEQGSHGADTTSPIAAKSSFVTRLAELLGTIIVWLAANAVLWFLLLGLPLLQRVPPILLGTAGIFANFYLIPWARNIGKRFRDYLEGPRVVG